MKTKFKELTATHPKDFKHYTTERIREEYLIEKLMEDDVVNIIYSHYDRFIVGSAVPVSNRLLLEPADVLKASYFLERRELGVINVGSDGIVNVDGAKYELNYKEALYIGSGNKEIIFESKNNKSPARFYLNSAPAHKSFPVKKSRPIVGTKSIIGNNFLIRNFS